MTPNLDALIAVVRDLRPDWPAASVRAALTDPSVRSRPYPDVALAVLALARDPESRSAGRLVASGPWWPGERPAERTPTPPPYTRTPPGDPAAYERRAAEARRSLAEARRRLTGRDDDPDPGAVSARRPPDRRPPGTGVAMREPAGQGAVSW